MSPFTKQHRESQAAVLITSCYWILHLFPMPTCPHSEHSPCHNIWCHTPPSAFSAQHVPPPGPLWGVLSLRCSDSESSFVLFAVHRGTFPRGSSTSMFSEGSIGAIIYLFIYLFFYLLTSKTSIKRFTTSKRLKAKRVYLHTRCLAGRCLRARSRGTALREGLGRCFLWRKSVRSWGAHRAALGAGLLRAATTALTPRARPETPRRLSPPFTRPQRFPLSQTAAAPQQKCRSAVSEQTGEVEPGAEERSAPRCRHDPAPGGAGRGRRQLNHPRGAAETLFRVRRRRRFRRLLGEPRAVAAVCDGRRGNNTAATNNNNK